MTKRRFSRWPTVAALGLAGLLSACGGGGAQDAPAPAPTPQPQPEPHPQARACTPEAFADVRIPGAVLQTAASVPAGTHRGQADLPAFCLITAKAQPTSQSDINFELWVPEGDAWNGKLVATGNGGYSPALSYGDMAYAMRQGYAVLGGDTGHQTEDMLWGVNNQEKIIDWGTRSINSITVAGKQYLSELRAEPAKRSYYLGCSTGGQQGFAEAQRYPEDFDGIIAGAPGNNRTALNIEFMWRFRANRPDNVNNVSYLSNAKLQFLTSRAVAACDGLDGVMDGVIDDPRQCTTARFNPDALLCTGAETSSCLTAEQLNAAKKIYQGPRNPRTGAQLYPGWPVGGESGWGSYMGGTEPTRADFWRYWTFDDPKWNWWSFDFDRDVSYANAKIAPLVDQTNPDLSRFKASGGKLLVYHGWNDPVVSAYDSINYYEQVRARQGSQAATDEFYRLMLVPGMGHCSGGPGATTLRADGTLIPNDPSRDLLGALDRWVEQGQAPDDLVAARVTRNAVERTRPLCSYPKQAVYSGAGDTNAASSYRCQ
ncbi:tannase/feruloyl esterase family alpha/beta hydrolase [Comamonas endophytica]|uniref:Tannase/feruloyl esterase family alpha/beta hydrolase n=1 Tax=Comamonas endophytica TaxID=2949090 RepID=A0ABY6G5X9_9BURK|nr:MULTISPECIES: tannase/feruloyl esterase family alpha/beta hydrolase [unclassified Acidovorax]MCD2511013.1 tannase/feruloyl esterase family alpha/beta hydrolase [Acidovorax sp. D4N7]UYG50420.1 tannase/feruloyl esterase family alpha/beta hydrolase [Acidovorax sp. 5MLIR]